MQPPPADYREYKPRCKFIALFNHKGGVAKTTSTFSFAWGMASLGYRVIMVDADVQTNLTTLALDHRLEVGGYPDVEAYLRANVRRPRTLGEGLTWREAMIPADTVLVAEFPARSDEESPGQLRLLAGDTNLTKNEEGIANAVVLPKIAGGEHSANLLGAPYHLALMTAQRFEADFVVFDLSPAITTMNRILLASCDYYILPCFGDKFTLSAVKALKDKITHPRDGLLMEARKWRAMQLALEEDSVASSFDESEGEAGLGSATSLVKYKMPEPRPAFLGTIMTRFNLVRGKPPTAIEAMVEAVNGAAAGLRNKLIEAGAASESVGKGDSAGSGRGARSSSPASPPARFAFTDAEYYGADEAVAEDDHHAVCLMEMPDFTSMMAYSQYIGVPAPFLTYNRMKAMCKWSVAVVKHDTTGTVKRAFVLQSKRKSSNLKDGFDYRLRLYRVSMRKFLTRVLRLMALDEVDAARKERMLKSALAPFQPHEPRVYDGPAPAGPFDVFTVPEVEDDYDEGWGDWRADVAAILTEEGQAARARRPAGCRGGGAEARASRRSGSRRRARARRRPRSRRWPRWP